jgi:hypothetical protein
VSRAVARLRHAPAIAVLAAAALGIGPASAASPASHWTLRLAIQYLPPASNDSQYDAVVIESGKVWLLGGSDVGGHGKPEVEQVSNGVPSQVPLPAGPHSWITAASGLAKNDIWAATYLGGSVLHWDGKSWVTEPRGGWKTGTRFTGITAVSPTSAWVFGTTGQHREGAGTWHFDGTKWTKLKGIGGGIYQASAVSATDVWAVANSKGEDGGGGVNDTVAHFTGTRWQAVRPAALAGFRFTAVLALSASNVWVAGSAGGKPMLGHFDGHHWTALRVPGTVAATTMCPDGQHGIWVVANSGFAPAAVLHRSASGKWTNAVVSSNLANRVLACALVPNTARVWGAGKAAAPHGSAAAGYRYG